MRILSSCIATIFRYRARPNMFAIVHNAFLNCSVWVLRISRRAIASGTHASGGVGCRPNFRALILCNETLREKTLCAFDDTVAQTELLFLSLIDFVLTEANECVDGRERCSCVEMRCRSVAAFPGTGCRLLLEGSWLEVCESMSGQGGYCTASRDPPA